MKQVHFHGELCILEVEEIPAGGNKLDTQKDYKLADSENTGNDHMLATHNAMAMYGFDEDVYLETREEAKVYCLLKDRHDDLILPPGNYKITPAKEYDHLKQEKRNVVD